MEKYTDVIYRHPDVENFGTFIIGQCNSYCLQNQMHYEYPPPFAKNCSRRCERIAREFEVFVAGTKEVLQRQIEECEKDDDPKTVKDCIFRCQEKTFANIRNKGKSISDSLF